jgi:hypothetical protein
VKRLGLLVLAGAFAGCATTGAPDAPKRYKPLASYAADAFVPVNLYLNSNEQLSGTHERLVEYCADQLRGSGAFVRVDRGVQRWPITLQARYQFREDVAGGDGAWRALSWLWLRLVPVRVTQTHTLVAEVLAEPDSVGAMELSVTVRDRLSLYDSGDPERGERAAADALLERLLAEIAQRKLIPRWATFKPSEPPKKKKEAEGRPT